jgi:diguanylate cyclase (GGDEF)-like protein
MISSLPIDALKLDMHFVRNAFKDQRDTRLLEVIIDIADHLAVPVIAEGVETSDQLFALRELGCDIAQGYYFSRPVPAEEFGAFIQERAAMEPEALVPETMEKPAEEKIELPETHPDEHTLPLRSVNIVFVALAFILTVLLFISDLMLSRSHVRMDEVNQRYIRSEQASSNLEAGSDYLTVSARSFAVTGDLRFLEDYFEEVLVTRRRDSAVADLKELLHDEHSAAYTALAGGLEYSNELMKLEYRAMRLTQLGYGYPDEAVPEEVSGFMLSPEEEALSPERKKETAVQLLFGDEYLLYKDQIREQVLICSNELVTVSEEDMSATRLEMDRLMQEQSALLIALVLAVLGEVVYVTTQVRMPLTRMVEHMRTQETIPPSGAEELRFVTRTYNEILGEISKKQKVLSYEATHDALTELGNRGYYENFLENADLENIALLIIDVDKFKSINDTYGHDVGDRILRKVAGILKHSFRSVDAVCRLGGDEFVVVMTRANSTMEQLVLNKISRANALLQEPEEGLPKVSLSVGVAFSDRKDPEGDIFKDADTALYRVKGSGGCGCAIYGSELSS